MVRYMVIYRVFCCLLLACMLVCTGCCRETTSRDKAEASNALAFVRTFTPGERFYHYEAIDIDGKTVFSLPLGCSPQGKVFSGYCPVSYESAGYIDTQGMRIDLGEALLYASSFSEGLAVIRGTNTFYFLEKDGTKHPINVDPRETRISEFHNGIAYICLPFGRVRPLVGCINRQGKVIIEPRFEEDEIGLFHEGFAWFYVTGKDRVERFGFFNDSGEIAIKAQYSDAGDFGDGLAPVKNQQGNWSYIDTSGKEVLSLGNKYTKCYGFNNGIAFVRSEKVWGTINRQGVEINKPIDIIPLFDNTVDLRYDYDLEGPWAMEPDPLVLSFTSPSFSDGFLRVKVNGKYGVLNKNFEYVVEPKYEKIGLISNGLVAAKNEAGKWGYLSTRGEEVSKFIFDYTSDFSDGFAFALVDDSDKCLMKRGNTVVEYESQYLGSYKNGLACIADPFGRRYDAKFGVVDQKGKLIADFLYDTLFDYSEGFAAYKTTLYGYVDCTGSFAIPPQYADAGNFSNGLAAVSTGSFWGYANTSGQLVIPASFEDAGEFSEGFACVYSDNAWHFIDSSGKKLVDMEFDCISPFQDGRANGWNDGMFYVFPNGSLKKAKIDYSFGDDHVFSEGLLGFGVAMDNDQELWGYRNRKKVVIKPSYSRTYPFVHGYAMIEKQQDGKPITGIIDMAGKEVISIGLYPELDICRENRIGFQDPKTGKYGFLDTDANIVVTPVYDAVMPFYCGRAAVKVGDKWGYIDTSGATVIKPAYYYVTAFKDPNLAYKVGPELDYFSLNFLERYNYWD